ncbi:MAG: YitT family protein, partial [Acidimicrobiia bacterium]
MQPIPPWAELRRRGPMCLIGLTVFATGIALTVRAHLGLAPWDVFHQGLGDRIGAKIGTVAIAAGMVILLAWIPLRQRIGLGTIANTVLVGVVLNGVLALIDEFDPIGARWCALVGGTMLIALGTGLYIGSGLGAGPRDGVMMGLHQRGWSITRARTGIEVSVLAAGWALGGNIGIGTVVGAFAVGPLVHLALPR